MSEVKDDLKREKVRIVEISKIKDFPDHPFLVKDDESMAQLVNSIRMNGVLNPVIARKVDEEHYELISGHRRKHACILLGIDRIPLIGREMSREEAVIEMVDSNLQREFILPSEKARAYKMKMDAMKQQGKRSDLTCPPMVEKLKGKEALTASRIGADAGDSHEQVRRYIRLNELTPELLEFVDEGKIGMRPAVELAQQTNVNTRSRFICYDIHELGKQLMPIGMLVVLDSILNRITENRAKGRKTYIFIDEIYLLFQHDYSANFLFTMWKKVRKYNAYILGITQNVEDLLQSHTARTMLANSELVIMLNQAATDREQLAELMGISDLQMSYITNVEAGHGLVKIGGALVPFVNNFPKDTQLYKLMTTKPGE